MVQREQALERFVVQVGQPRLVAAHDFLGQLFFRLDQSVDAFLECAHSHHLVDEYLFLLADALGPVGGLVFDGRVPPAIEVDDVIRSRQGNARAAGA